MDNVDMAGCACSSIHMFQVENLSKILMEFVMKAVPLMATPDL
jgi:hypothetical protein